MTRTTHGDLAGACGVWATTPNTPWANRWGVSLTRGDPAPADSSITLDGCSGTVTLGPEHYDHTGNNEEAVRVGLQQTGRLITGAALIMVAVFASFAGGRLVEMQQMGFGLAFAVLLDATLIRTILVPATLKLIGNANWHLPRFLQWLPDVRVEGDLAPIRLPRKQERWEAEPSTHPDLGRAPVGE